jgi:hypothetical protein
MFDPSDSVKLRNAEKKRRSRLMRRRGLACVKLWVDVEKVRAAVRRRQHLNPSAEVSDQLMTHVLEESIVWWWSNWLAVMGRTDSR